MIQDGYYQGKLANTVYWWEGNCRGAYSSLKQAKAARAANPSFCALPLAPFESDWQLLEPIGQERRQGIYRFKPGAGSIDGWYVAWLPIGRWSWWAPSIRDLQECIATPAKGTHNPDAIADATIEWVCTFEAAALAAIPKLRVPNPPRPGVYMTRWVEYDKVTYAYWTGREWNSAYDQLEIALQVGEFAGPARWHIKEWQELEQSTSASTGVKVEAPSPKPAGIRGQPATDRRRKLLIL